MLGDCRRSENSATEREAVQASTIRAASEGVISGAEIILRMRDKSVVCFWYQTESADDTDAEMVSFERGAWVRDLLIFRLMFRKENTEPRIVCARQILQIMQT